MISTASEGSGAGRQAWLQPTRTGVGLAFLVLALLALPFADLSVGSHDPWLVLKAVGAGFLHPDFGAVEDLGGAAAMTVAFAFCGVGLGAMSGFALALGFGSAAVRALAAVLRSIHELIWALLLMAVSGPSAVTGVAAIALAYAGIFGKVFAEIFEEADQRPADLLPAGSSIVSRFLYGRLPLVLGSMRIYTLYRLECGLRSSAVLGFVGMPTLGFQLDSFFKQGAYGAVAAVLIVYYLLIATIRWWVRPGLVPLYLVGSIAVLALHPGVPTGGSSLWTFLTHDIVPAPLRAGHWLDPATWTATAGWLTSLLATQVLPGAWNTIVIGQITLALMGLFALLVFPAVVPRLTGRLGSLAGHALLVVGRSTPEYMLAYLFLQVLGPSMLPAVLALALHNGAIIGHLVGRQADGLTKSLRSDAPTGLDLYAYELVPRLYGGFLAFCLYRWEIVLRETAILGILGVKTLGFYIDSAVSELRMDRAMLLVAATAFVTLAADAISRRLRGSLRLGSVVKSW